MPKTERVSVQAGGKNVEQYPSGVDVEAVREQVRVLDHAHQEAYGQLSHVGAALGALIGAAEEGADKFLPPGLQEILKGLQERCRQASEKSDEMSSESCRRLYVLIGEW